MKIKKREILTKKRVLKNVKIASSKLFADKIA
jgi:hypothetical protein